MGAGKEILELGTRYGKRLIDELSNSEKKILKELSDKAKKEKEQAATLKQEKNKEVTSRKPASGETTVHIRGDTDLLPAIEENLKKNDLKNQLVKNLQEQATSTQTGFGKFDNEITANKQKKLEQEAYKGAAGQKLTTPKDGFALKSSGNTPNVPAVIPASAGKRQVLKDNLLSDKGKVETATGKNTGINTKNFLKNAGVLGGAGAISTTIGEDDFREDPIVEPEKEEEAIPAAGQVVGPADKKTTETTTTEKKVTYPKINLGESEEAKALAEQIKTSQATLSALKDPPITPQEMRQAAYDGLEKARKSRANLLQWGEVFENLVGAIAKYGAAREGLNRGLDMSNAEIRRTDWNSKIKQAFAEYESDLDNLTSKYDKENQAKDKVDSKRLALDTKLGDLRSAIGRARDIRAREQARLDMKRQEMLTQARQKQEDRVLKENIAKAKAAGKENIDNFVSEFTDDPATARELKIAAMQGDKEFEKTINLSGVRDKLKPDAVKNYMKAGWFGFGEEKVDPEAMRKQVLQPQENSQKSPQYNIQRGDVSDGYVFLGGNPNDPNSWKELK